MADTHNTEISITTMVFSRLPFLEVSDTNNTLISMFIVDVMYELEPCFKVDKDLTEGLPTRIGDESNYGYLQRSIIADIVACYILLIRMAANIGGVAATATTEAQSASKFLKSAQAGSVRVEWEQFDLNKATLAMSGEKLLDRYRATAIRKAASLGCLIDITDGATLAQLMIEPTPYPFTVITIGDCGCKGGDGIPERFDTTFLK